MKKQSFYSAILSFGLGILMVFNTVGLQAQSNNLKFTTLATGNIGLSYERALSTRRSVGLGLFTANRTYEDSRTTDYSNSGYRVVGAYRLYFNQGRKSLNGFYVAPNISVGKHLLTYQEVDRSGFGLLGIFIDALDGEFDANYSPKEIQEPITGSRSITAISGGVKIGIQKRYQYFNLDFGVDLSQHTTGGTPAGIALSNGDYKAYENDIKGGTAALYLGLGFAF